MNLNISSLAFMSKNTIAPRQKDTRKEVTIISDLDGTWISKDKNQEELNKLNRGIKDLWWKLDGCRPDGIKLRYGFLSARPPSRIMSSGAILPPHFSVAYNGGEFYRGKPIEANKVKEWDDILAKSNFDSKEVLEVAEQVAKSDKFSGMQVETMGQVVKNLDADKCKYLATLCVHKDSIKLDPALGETKEMLEDKTYKTPKQVLDYMNEIQKKIKKSGMKSELTGPYPFHGKPYLLFDVAAPLANKGSFVDWFMKDYVKNDKPENFIVLGDGGNDLPMMPDDGRRVVVVGPNKQLREAAAKFKKNTYIIRPADENPSKGVHEGIKIHLDQIQKGIKRSIAFAGRLLAGKQNAGKQKDAA